MRTRRKHIVHLLACLTLVTIVSGYALPALALQKPRVAILEAKVSDKVSKYARKHLNLEKLQAEMEASFLAARKFEVVTRNKESLGVILDEQQFANSDYSAGDAAESGKLQNANFLIRPEVHIFSFYASTHKVPHLQSKYFRTDHGVLEINAVVLDTKTGQVKTTFALKSTFGTKERMVNHKGGVPSPVYFTKLAKNVSAQMVDQFLDLVFPVKIIKVKNLQVYLNRGKDGGFKKGQVLKVFAPGEELIDPDTGENIGSAEEYVGKIEITRVNPKFTIAKILPKSREGDITKGCIVRK